jgi:hypothetical protein
MSATDGADIDLDALTLDFGGCGDDDDGNDVTSEDSDISSDTDEDVIVTKTKDDVVTTTTETTTASPASMAAAATAAYDLQMARLRAAIDVIRSDQGEMTAEKRERLAAVAAAVTNTKALYAGNLSRLRLNASLVDGVRERKEAEAAQWKEKKQKKKRKKEKKIR